MLPFGTFTTEEAAGPDRDPVHYGREQPITPGDPSIRRSLCFLGREDRACVD